MNNYLAYNNVPLLTCCIMAILSRHSSIDITRLSCLTSLLMNPEIARKATSYTNNIKFPAFIKTNRALLDTFNQHYYGLLPHYVTALSILIDMGCITIVDNLIRNDRQELFDDLRENSKSERLNDICKATDFIYSLTSQINTRTLINSLRIEL